MTARLTAALDKLRAHLTQRDLARRLGLSVGYLSSAKHRNPSRPLVLLLEALARHPEDLDLIAD